MSSWYSDRFRVALEALVRACDREASSRWLSDEMLKAVETAKRVMNDEPQRSSESEGKQSGIWVWVEKVFCVRTCEEPSVAAWLNELEIEQGHTIADFQVVSLGRDKKGNSHVLVLACISRLPMGKV